MRAALGYGRSPGNRSRLKRGLVWETLIFILIVTEEYLCAREAWRITLSMPWGFRSLQCLLSRDCAENYCQARALSRLIFWIPGCLWEYAMTEIYGFEQSGPGPHKLPVQHRDILSWLSWQRHALQIQKLPPAPIRGPGYVS